jgi:phosphatidylglycerophosphate synthase
MPEWVTPNGMTAVGFIGAGIAAAAYALSRWHPEFLWLATFGLLINWFGDSLDGTIARARRIERPRFGFFLDQNLDALAQFIFAIGVGLSGSVRFDLVMVTLAAYLLMTILNLVRAVVSNVFALTFSGIGLTELRLGFAVFNALVYFFPPKPIAALGLGLSFYDVFAVLWILTMVVSFLVGFRSGLQELAMEEPRRGGR